MLTIDSKNNITLTRGDTLTLKCTPKVKDTGEEYVPQEGDSFRFAISKYYLGEAGYELMCEAVISKETWLTTISAENTKKLDYTTYHYDAEVTHEDGTVDTYLSGDITITGEAK